VSNEIIDTKPLGPEGPLQTEIDEAKEQYGNIKACFLGGNVYLIRMMTRKEHLEFMSDLEQRVDADAADFDVDEIVASKFTVWPANIEWGEQPGGVVGVLSQEISKYSGFIRDKESIEL